MDYNNEIFICVILLFCVCIICLLLSYLIGISLEFLVKLKGFSHKEYFYGSIQPQIMDIFLNLLLLKKCLYHQAGCVLFTHKRCYAGTILVQKGRGRGSFRSIQLTTPEIFPHPRWRRERNKTEHVCPPQHLYGDGHCKAIGNKQQVVLY